MTVSRARSGTLGGGSSIATDVQNSSLTTPFVIGRSPLSLFFYDLRLFLTLLLPRLPLVFLPLRSLRSIFADITPLGLLFQIFLFLYSILLIVPLLLLGTLVAGVTPFVVAYLLLLPTQWVQGSALVQVPIRQSPVRNLWSSRRQRSGSFAAKTPNTYPHEHKGEAWFFINGIATSRSGVMLDLKRLEQLFQRPITGIMNRSSGLILDLLECVVQRDISLYTQDVRTGYVQFRAALEAQNTNKVVILCHSQGCIIASLIIDLLLATVSRDVLDKLEVYTFANASNHFSNPLNVLGKPTIHYMEHFANGRDPISQLGVLQFATQQQKRNSLDRSRDADDTYGSRRGTAAFTFDDDQYGIARDVRSADPVMLYNPASTTKRRASILTVNTGGGGGGGGGAGTGAASTDAASNGRPNGNNATATTVTLNGAGSDALNAVAAGYPTPLPRVQSAAGQLFSGRLFVRWQQSGHLLINHYLLPQHNILDTPEARQYSRLRQYLGGKSPVD